MAPLSPEILYGYLKNCVFLHLDTVARYPAPEALPSTEAWLWQQKLPYLEAKEGQTETELYQQKAAHWAEFAQVAGLALAYFSLEPDGQLVLRAQAISSRTEADLLHHLGTALLNKRFQLKDLQLIGHNAKEYSVPLLARRYMAAGIALPTLLQTQYRKPWEVPVVDTMELWRITERKNYSSLTSIAATLGLPVHPDLLQTSADRALQVHTAFHTPEASTQKDLKAITYIAKLRVALTAQVYLRIRQLPALEEHQILWR